MTPKKTLGTCSLCGGAVQVPTAFMSINPPVPTCSNCGARMKQTGPVIEMEEPKRKPKVHKPKAHAHGPGPEYPRGSYEDFDP